MVSTRGRTRVTEKEDTTMSRHTRTRTASNTASRSAKANIHADSVDDAENSNDEGSDWEASKHQRKRTKRSHKKDATRGRFGLKFQSVLTLPFDIQLEIFSWLAPKDLISIARINKEFRKTLMQRNATRIWKLARQSQEVPEPPATMSEPQWAVLLFDGSRCSECGTNNVHHIDFGIMKRACVSCRKFSLVCPKKFKKEYSEYDEILLEMIPHTHYGGWAHGRRSNGTFYWLQDIHDIAKTWATHQDAIHRRVPGAKQRADAFHEAKKAVVKSLHDGVQEYTKWYRGVLWNRACAGDDKLRSRHDEIYKRFADMGYAYVDIDTMRYSQEVCQRRPLTERIWKRIQPILETSIRANRQLRIVRFRKDTFQQVFEVYLRSRHPREWPDHLDTQQAAEIPAVSSLLNAEWDVQVSREDLQALLTPEAMAAWAGRRKSELISGVAEFHSSGRMEAHDDTRGESSGNLPQSIHLGDPHTDSDLATSIFACSCCNGSLCRSGRQLKNIWFGWQAALRHTCLRPRLPISARDGPGRMTFEPAAHAMAVTLVTEAGLQPETASVKDMDNTGARWFCTSTQACRLSNEIAFDWKSAVAHAMSGAHYDAPAVYKKLTEYQLQHIEFPFPSSFPQKWGCGHCDVHFFTGDNHDRVSAHLKDVHQIENPVEGDDIIRFHERLSFQPLPLELCKVPPEPEQSTHAP